MGARLTVGSALSVGTLTVCAMAEVVHSESEHSHKRTGMFGKGEIRMVLPAAEREADEGNCGRPGALPGICEA